MANLSEIIRKPVTDLEGKPVGMLKDIVVRSGTENPRPLVEAVVIQRRGRELTVPFIAVAALFSPVVPLKYRQEDVPVFEGRTADLDLVRDLLGKQVLDSTGMRIVRVRDVELVHVEGVVYVNRVDIGAFAILHRLGLSWLAHLPHGWLKTGFLHDWIAWQDVELLRRDQSKRLQMPIERMRDLHPADLAEILSNLNKQESGQFLEGLDVGHLADALEEVEPDFQASLVEGMPDEKVADVLDEMEPDEAADLLADLPQKRKEDLLGLMEKEPAENVRKLLAYPKNTAGGIMTTEFAAIPPGLPAAEAIKVLHRMADEVETIFYVYVVDEEGHLLGVFSLNNLIFARPGTLVRDFMDKRVISVKLDDDQESVAQVVAKYDLLAVPVVDEQNRLQGIVTADDALDKIIPTAWKKRLPRFYR